MTFNYLKTLQKNCLIYIPLKKELKKGESVKLELKYTLKLPNDKFTGYGMSENALHLKYFFIVPDSFETPMQEEKNYIAGRECKKRP